MEKVNIWENFNFSEKKGKSSLDYLVEIESQLISKTGGILKLEIESMNSSRDQFTHWSGNILNNVYIVSNTLGGYRKKIITVIENNDSYFPVSITSDYTEIILQSEEKDFLDNLEQMLLVPEIKRTIENLYHQSS